MNKQTIDRKIVIGELRANRRTYQEIATILGITKQRVHQIYKDYIITEESIRHKVKTRDEEKCAICGSTKNLEVHHINGVKRDNHLDNLVTLCRKCHHKLEKIEKQRKKIKPEKFRNGIREGIRIKKICEQCGKEFEIPKRWENQKFCSRKCSGQSRKIYKDINEKWRVYARRYYQKHYNDLHFREKIRERNMKYYRKKSLNKVVDKK